MWNYTGRDWSWKSSSCSSSPSGNSSRNNNKRTERLDKIQSFWAPWSLEIQPTETAKCWTSQVLVSAFTHTLSTHFAFFPPQQNNNNSTRSCESTQEGAGRQTKAITHRFTLCRNWHYSIHQAHKRGMETAQWQDTSLVLICCWMAPLSVFFTPLPPPFALTINKQAEERAARKKSNTTLNEKCSQSLNQKCPRRHQIWMQMNAPAAVPSFESDSTEQRAPGTVHHPHWQTAISLLSDKKTLIWKKSAFCVSEERSDDYWHHWVCNGL